MKASWTVAALALVVVLGTPCSCVHNKPVQRLHEVVGRGKLPRVRVGDPSHNGPELVAPPAVLGEEALGDERPEQVVRRRQRQIERSGDVLRRASRRLLGQVAKDARHTHRRADRRHRRFLTMWIRYLLFENPATA